MVVVCFFFFKQKTAYEMRISDWSSDVCSSDLLAILAIRKEVHKLAIRSRVYGILKNRKIVIALKRLTRIIRLVFGSSTFGFIFPRKSTRRFARRSRLCRGLSVFMYNAQNYNLRLNGIRTRRFVLRAADRKSTRLNSSH